MSDEYIYEDDQGKPQYRVVRYSGKQFRQEHTVEGNGHNGDWINGRGMGDYYPYRLTEVLAAIDRGEPIYICEGEKDVHTARLQGITATCNSGGAGKWRDSDSEWLRGAEPVYIIWDKDDSGKAHALSVEASLRKVGVSDIRFLRARTGNDLSDHIASGLTMKELVKRKPLAKPIEDAPDKRVNDQELRPAAFELALNRLQQVTPELGKPNQYNALCPVHGDTSPSLSIALGDEVAVMVTCHAGCTHDEIARALGINPVEFTALPVAKRDWKMQPQEQMDELFYRRELARENAQRRRQQERAHSAIKFGDKELTLRTELEIPLTPIKWFVDSWFRSGSTVLMNADPKAGKTRLALNMVQACIEEAPFLGHFQTSWPEGARAWYGNWDMPDELFRDYLHDYTWAEPDRLIIEHIGALEFPFWLEDVRDDFVQYAQRMNIQLMIVDTLHVASQGFVKDFNDNDEVSRFIHSLRNMCKEAKIANLLMLHHTGHSDKTRGRGASTLAADVDGTWNLRMDESEKHDSPRFLSAKGRKLGVSPLELVYNMGEERYTTSMQTRSAGVDLAEAEAFCERVTMWKDVHGDWPRVTDARGLTKKKNALRTRALKLWEGLGYIRRYEAEGGARIMVLKRIPI